jgi:hypothetical protein
MEWLIAMLTALVGSVGCTFESNPKEEHPAVVEQQSAGTTAPKWVDFYADLDGVYPTASAPNRTSAVIVRNHSTENDDGGGVFRWIVGTPPAANNGTIRIPPGSSGGYWKRIYDGAISVRWFGAKGNNAGNDAPAINGAIDAAGAAGGGIVFTIFGNKVGNWEDVNLQACAVEVVAGASTTSFAIVGNSFFNNKYNRVCNPGGFTPVVGQRVIANNACGTSQAGGPSGYCHYAQGSY